MFADKMSEAEGGFADQSQVALHRYQLGGRSPIAGPSNNQPCPRARRRAEQGERSCVAPPFTGNWMGADVMQAGCSWPHWPGEPPSPGSLPSET